MPPKFHELTLAEFDELVDRFEFHRHIDAVHMHHTWRPRIIDFRGEATIEAMWRVHTQENGWSDIAQHVTIAPDGKIWTGRDWNRPPASAKGFNGSATAGPFMFETIGDFDLAREALAGAQRDAAVHVIAKLWDRFALPPSSLRFHCEMNAGKSCPGTSVDKAAILAEAEARLELLMGGRRVVRGFRWAGAQYAAPAARARSIAESFARNAPPSAAPVLDGELAEGDGRREAAARGSGLTSAQLAELRAHVVTMRNGGLTSSGELPTVASDVEAIFARHLPDWWRTQGRQRPLRVMLWAHGGLIDEASGLGIAYKQAEWWKRNGVYPIFFVWESGFFDALEQILFGARDRGERLGRGFGDEARDLVIESSARALGLSRIWGAMKESAERASQFEGAARSVVEHLARFYSENASSGQIEIFAAGHSAGSIFHAHLLPTAFAQGLPPVRELFFLAPAIRTDLFKRTLMPLVGTAIQRLTVLTMNETLERADSVGPYRKSLLYLVSRALESGGSADILGLQESIHRDAELRALFALDGGPRRHAEIIWSDGTEPQSPREGSTSHSHGAFDDNRATMNTLAHRVTAASSIVDFPTDQRAFATIAAAPQGVAVPALAALRNGAGRRLALCVGIDAYPDPRYVLAGCVADARDWQAALQGRGFDVRARFDGEATQARILGELEELVVSAGPGDVIVFQFAGHGTQLDDLDGDDEDGKDEAFVPYDFAGGGFVLDDDLWRIFARLPDDVNLTCFFDCCHSGTITRVFGAPPMPTPSGARARYLVATPEMQAAHRAFRSRSFRALGPRPLHDRSAMRSVVFSACLDEQVAYELGGHGEFTKRATPILQQASASLTNRAFGDAVVRAFGPAARQTPMLDCPDAARDLGLLAAATTNGHAPASAVVPASAPARQVDLAVVGARLREIAEMIDGGR